MGRYGRRFRYLLHGILNRFSEQGQGAREGQGEISQNLGKKKGGAIAPPPEISLVQLPHNRDTRALV